MKMLILSKALPTGMRALKHARLKDISELLSKHSKTERSYTRKSSMRRMCSIVAFALAVAACRGDADSANIDMVQIERGKKNKAVATPAPPPPPAPTTTPTPTTPITLAGAAAIASNFDPETELVAIPLARSNAPDVVGAFRFICMPGQLKSDDPIVYPGQPGRSHLHQFFGNELADANSTYESLRTTGNSTCMSPVNRSAYWMPAVLNGNGKVVRPDYVSIYYKRRPSSDPISSDPSHPQYEGQATKLPNGLRFIFGRDMLNLSGAASGKVEFDCEGASIATPKPWRNFEDAQAGCPVSSRIGVRIIAPGCWDGKNLDSPDHRSHVAYQSSDDRGYSKCPTSHPYVIPTFTMAAWFTQAAGETYSLVSDAMDTSPGHKRGDTFHADFFMAWDPIVHDLWEKNCIDKLLDCSAGDLGNGKMIKQSWAQSWTANPRLVDIPASHAH